MAGRPSTTGTPDAWRAVADAVRSRRRELRLVGRDIENAGVSRTILSLIENGRQDRYETRLLVNLCRALQWAPDSIDRLLEGGQPVVALTSRNGTTETRAPAALSGKLEQLSQSDRAYIEGLVDRLLGEDQ